ncbi:cell adhesion molecule 1-like [Hyperolius riggenbachi]|uniref:cell adhesion molecule 1-like n=1 Tax=Hyperolius riggenbachi TaxID=752182 RepID=UPI0035A26A19
MALPTPLTRDASPVTATVSPSGDSDKIVIGGPPPFNLSSPPPVNYTTRGSEDFTSCRYLARCHHRPGTVSRSKQEGGVIIAALITVLAVVAIAIAYMYRHKGSYRTNEAMAGEASKALKENKADSNEEAQEDENEEKQEYMM